MYQDNSPGNEKKRAVLSEEALAQLLTTTAGEEICVLMLGYANHNGEDTFRQETGFDPTPEFVTCLDVHLSIAMGDLIDAGKKHFFTVLNDGISARMAHCCARIRDDASDPRAPVLWVVINAQKLTDCTLEEEKAIREADRVLAIREFDEERITDELVCSCGTILSVFSHPEEVPTLEGAAMAEIDIVNVNPAEILTAYNEQKQHRGKPAQQ